MSVLAIFSLQLLVELAKISNFMRLWHLAQAGIQFPNSSSFRSKIIFDLSIFVIENRQLVTRPAPRRNLIDNAESENKAQDQLSSKQTKLHCPHCWETGRKVNLHSLTHVASTFWVACKSFVLIFLTKQLSEVIMGWYFKLSPRRC